MMSGFKSELVGKRLLVLGGSDWKKDIDEFCKENGITIVVAGNDPSAGICEIADEYYNVDSTDDDKIKSLISDKQIDGIFSCASEAVIPHSIKDATDLGLYSYATIQQWNTLMNKKNMKNICSKYGLDVIEEYNPEEVGKNTIHYPVIVKPADSSGSRGITVCSNDLELQCAIGRAKECSKTNDLLIERYIVAPFWQMEIYIQEGVPYFGFTKERVFYPSLDGKAKQPFLDIYPSRYNDRIKDEVFPKFSQMAVEIGITNASIWVQGFITESHIFVFDLGFRLGGGMENRLMMKEKGVDNVLSHIAYALIGKWIGDYSKCQYPFETQYITVCVGLKNGTISNIEGIEELKKSPYIYDIIQYYKEGDTVTKSGLYKQTLMRIFVRAFPDSSNNLIKLIYDQIKVRDTRGEDMLLSVNNLEWDNELPV